jgi:dethiobiotin synthetase
MNYFVTAIDTDSGKTIVSAILSEALNADYWKPVQAGLPRDADLVQSLLSNSISKIHPETYLLQTPASPHAAARKDGIEIQLENFKLPLTKNTLIIEGAGGCMVPLNDHDFVIDLIKQLNTPAILVADLYLGSINHTLLTVAMLKAKSIPVRGIIFNGNANPESERIILKHTNLNVLLKIDREALIDKSAIKKYAHLLRENWNE